MRTLYFDCFSGASGDMLLGALVDLGLDVAALEAEIAKLGLDDVRLVATRVERASLAATKVDVVIGGKVEGVHGVVHEHGHPHHEEDDAQTPAPHEHGQGASRSLPEILDLIGRSSLAEAVKAS